MAAAGSRRRSMAWRASSPVPGTAGLREGFGRVGPIEACGSGCRSCIDPVASGLVGAAMAARRMEGAQVVASARLKRRNVPPVRAIARAQVSRSRRHTAAEAARTATSACHDTHGGPLPADGSSRPPRPVGWRSETVRAAGDPGRRRAGRRRVRAVPAVQRSPPKASSSACDSSRSRCRLSTSMSCRASSSAGVRSTRRMPMRRSPRCSTGSRREFASLLDEVVALDFPFLGACYGVGTVGSVPGRDDRTACTPSRSASCRSR